MAKPQTLLLCLLSLGCVSREELQANAPPAIAFHSPGKLRISNQADEAEKRGFADFTGDGITDMIEIVDLAWFGQEWVGRIFKGEKTADGLVTFLDPYQVALPITEEWFTSQTKFDTADINGDGYADVVIAQLDDDKYTIQVGINQRDGKTFQLVKNITYDDQPLGSRVFQVVASLPIDDDHSINDFFKMDWADVDGDKKDDLFLMWESNSDNLSVEVWLSESSSDVANELRFGGKKSFQLNDLLHNLSIRELDTEDVNGDHRADFWLYDPSVGDGLRIVIATNEGNRYALHKDFVGEELDLDVIGFDKMDSFDVNLDGCADYIHVGTLWSDCYMSYLLAPCSPAK